MGLPERPRIRRGRWEPLGWSQKLEPGGKSVARNVTLKTHEEQASVNTEGGKSKQLSHLKCQIAHGPHIWT